MKNAVCQTGRAKVSRAPKGELNGRIVLKTMREVGKRILLMVLETKRILTRSIL